MIPVTLVSGFLGAGKTTLLNRILRGDHGLRMAVMVNDFGAIDIDSQLIVERSETMMSLANGCICCTVESDLIEQLDRLLSLRERPQYLVIEASGVSNPGKIASTLRYPRFRQALSIDGIITVVDAEQFSALEGEMAQLAMEQLDVADIIVLNKIDQVSREQLDALQARWFYPGARVLEACRGDVPLELILGVGCFDPQRHAAQTHCHEHGEECLHDHAQLFDSWSWSSERPLSLEALRKVLAGLPSGIYRAKGVCQVVELPGKRCVAHLVGSRSELMPGEPWGTAARYSQLVLIGSHGSLDRQMLQAQLDSCQR